MPCNCGKKKPPVGSPKPSSSATQEFSLNMNGSTQTFGSKLERDAALVRLTSDTLRRGQ